MVGGVIPGAVDVDGAPSRVALRLWEASREAYTHSNMANYAQGLPLERRLR